MNYNIPYNCSYNHLNGSLKILREHSGLHFVSSLSLCGIRVQQTLFVQIETQDHVGNFACYVLLDLYCILLTST